MISREEEQTGGSLEETRFVAKACSGGDARAFRGHCFSGFCFVIQLSPVQEVLRIMTDMQAKDVTDIVDAIVAF